ncbi:hypothetical protein PtrV1_09509 [Pyrenophora tritici-repentis]|nr:hypothetical protein PtrV1_09509 [Pyrenophora tritici-repentis]
MRIEKPRKDLVCILKFGNMINMTGMISSLFPKDYFLYDPTDQANTRRIMLDTTYMPRSKIQADDVMRVESLYTRTDMEALASPLSRYVSVGWETWTINLPNGKKIVFWAKDVKGEERESTQLWTKMAFYRWKLTPHRRRPAYSQFALMLR